MTAVIRAILRFGAVVTFAESYDRHRPRPPQALLDLLTRLAGGARPRLVVDLGCGTGLSTRAWLGRADRVVGVEPDDAMRAVAEAAGGAEYVAADSSATGLPDACADVVTVSQALHWMDPEPTFAEAARVLRPGGVFAAYDYDAVPLVDPEVDEVFDAVLRRADALRRERGVWAPWKPGTHVMRNQHLDNLRTSGRFRFARELVLHSVEDGDAERLLGLIRSYGAIEMTKDADLGLGELEAVARRVLGPRTVPFWFGYRVRLAVK
jgi:SAM-dependent methyltransferase